MKTTKTKKAEITDDEIRAAVKILKEAKKVGEPYTATIKVLGKNYTAKGETIRGAINSLNVGSVAKGVSILTLSNGEISQSKILPANQTSRLFSAAKLVREITLKQVSMRFSL